MWFRSSAVGGVPEGAVRMAVIGPEAGRRCEDGAGEVGGRELEPLGTFVLIPEAV